MAIILAKESMYKIYIEDALLCNIDVHALDLKLKFYKF
jgi:hypothetical protein